MKLDIGTGAFMPTKEARRAQIATRPKREREEVRDDGPDIRRAISEHSSFASLAQFLGVDWLLIYHGHLGHYVRLPAKANDGKACSPRDRLSFFLEVGDIMKLLKADGKT